MIKRFDFVGVTIITFLLLINDVKSQQVDGAFNYLTDSQSFFKSMNYLYKYEVTFEDSIIYKKGELFIYKNNSLQCKCHYIKPIYLQESNFLQTRKFELGYVDSLYRNVYITFEHQWPGFDYIRLSKKKFIFKPDLIYFFLEINYRNEFEVYCLPSTNW